jgi:uncharacterized membrane protein YagU involved in acid resistance
MPHAVTAGRDELHSATDWSAAAWAGVIAGIVFMMLEMGMVRLFMGESPWAPPRMIAAMALGKEVLPPPDTYAPFDMKIMMMAMLIHFPLSIAYGLAVGWLVHRLDWVGGLLIGALFGIAIYVGNFYLVAPVMFPWFQMAQTWISALAHTIFGVVAGGGYVAIRKPKHALR